MALGRGCRTGVSHEAAGRPVLTASPQGSRDQPCCCPPRNQQKAPLQEQLSRGAGGVPRSPPLLPQNCRSGDSRSCRGPWLGRVGAWSLQKPRGSASAQGERHRGAL